MKFEMKKATLRHKLSKYHVLALNTLNYRLTLMKTQSKSSSKNCLENRGEERTHDTQVRKKRTHDTQVGKVKPLVTQRKEEKESSTPNVANIKKKIF